MRYKSLLVLVVPALFFVHPISYGQDHLQQGATAGNADLQFVLGYNYCRGIEVLQDYAEAVKWFRLAAEQGHVRAQFELGQCYINGTGVSPDYKEAIKWLSRSAEGGNVQAQWFFDVEKVHPQDRETALKLFRLGAEQGDAEAQLKLGLCHTYGYVGLNQDFEEGTKWFEMAAKQGNAEAQYYAGNSYFFGQGVATNIEQAISWWQLAIAQGYSKAQYALGRCYELGSGVPQDCVQAYAWYNIAAVQKYEKAMLRRAELSKLMTPAQITEGQQLSREYAGKFSKK